jgi:hypothetical protein
MRYLIIPMINATVEKVPLTPCLELDIRHPY